MRLRSYPVGSGLLALLLPVLSASGTIIISEFDATNRGVIRDADGSESDWIELHNTGGASVNLSGWALSDDRAEPGKWVFPSTTLAPGGYLVVFASGKDWRVPGTELHTNFSLSASGEDVVLSRPEGGGQWSTEHAWLDYPPQESGLSYGLAGSALAGAAGYFVESTPDARNGDTVATEFVADTAFSHKRGFYRAPFTLAISSPTPGASIVYTVDGSEPHGSSGITVPAPDASTPPTATLTITTTTVVRARAVKPGYAQTNVDTQTYLFPEAVLQQDASYLQHPSAAWGHSGPDWAMDPRVTGHANPEDRAVASDLEKIPTVSIALDWNELFGAGGIYIAGEGVDKRGSFELLNPDGNDSDPNTLAGEHGRGVVRVFGGSSTAKRWKTDKLSFRFNFWGEFQSGVLGAGAVGTYDRLVLDARLNNVWTQAENLEQRQFGDYARDAVLTDLENAMGVHAVHSQHVHLYLNGIYWGLYTLHERPDNHFAAAYFGGDPEDWDIVKHGPGHENFLVDGRRIDPTQLITNHNHTAGVHYLQMVALAQADLSIPANYEALAEKLDIPAFIVHILSNFAGGNYDWPQHNWYASFNREDPNGKWRFHSWDAEHVFKYVDYPRYDDVTGKFEGRDRPDGIHLQLLQNPDYRMAFADAAHRHLANGGALSAERVWEAFERRFADINEAIRAESARWGDNGPAEGELHLRFSNVPSRLSSPSGQSDTTAFASWWHERERIRTKILGPVPNRITRFIEQLRNARYNEDHPLSGQPNPLYPRTDAPTFSQFGGTVSSGFQLVIRSPHPAANATVYYTTDGTDPRQSGTAGSGFFSGAIHPAAQPYQGPISIGSATTVKARTLRDGEWSALTEAIFHVGAVEPASAANLAISEIHYHPTDPSLADLQAGYDDDGAFEFLEVLNIGSTTVSLEGLSVDQGLDIAPIPGGITHLAPGERALYVANPAAFAHRHGPGFPIAGWFMGTALSNSGERLHLVAADGTTIVDLTYQDVAPWPVEADGYGPSLVLIEPHLRDPANPANWKPSRRPEGSPAADEPETFAEWVVKRFPAGSSGNPAITGPTADPDEDGLSNLEEYFFGSDPLTPGSLSHPPAVTLESLSVDSVPGTYAVFTFRFRKEAESVDYTPLASIDLVGWLPASLVRLSSSHHPDGTETRRYRSTQPVTPDSRQFFRIQLDQR